MVRPVRMRVGLVEGGRVGAAVDEEVRGEGELVRQVVSLEEAQGEAGGQGADVDADNHEELKNKNAQRGFEK